MNNDKYEDLSVSGLSLDSRKVKPGDLFFAVPGTVVDGRDYINQAIQQGALAVVTENFQQGRSEKLPKHSGFDNIPIIEYSNLKNVIGSIASQYYQHPSLHMPVIGITGTNGKTSISHFIAQLCQKLGKTCGVVGTLGFGFLPNLEPFGLTTPDPILLQATLAELYQQGAELTAMEVTSHALAQDRVAGTEFQTAIFTNLTRDHLDYHGTLAEYFQAKQRLFTEYHPKNVILNLDDPYGQKMVDLLIQNVEQEKRVAPSKVIGISTEAEIPVPMKQAFQKLQALQMSQASNPLKKAEEKKQAQKCGDNKSLYGFITTHDLRLTDKGSLARIKTPWGEAEIFCPLLGLFNLNNVLASVAALCLEGEDKADERIQFDTLLQAVSHLKPVAGRTNCFGGKDQEPHIVIDYAHTPDALSKLLTALRGHCKGKLILVFGCGGERDAGKRPQMAKVAERFCDRIIVTQDNPRKENPEQIITDILKGFSDLDDLLIQKKLLIEPNRAKAIQLAIEGAETRDMIVIAGKGHEMFQIVGTQQIPFSDEHHAKISLDRRRQRCQS